jgi:hypothetical protein
MNASNAVVYILPLPVFVIVLSLVMMCNPVALAQLEIPEAKPVDTNEDNVSNSSDTSDYLTFDDPGLGYSIAYPNDWQVVEPNVEYGLSGFTAPDYSATVTVKLIPASDRSLSEFGEEIQDSEFFQLTEFYRNSSTTLGGLPALIDVGIFTYAPNMFQQAAGEQGYTSRIYQTWGLSEQRDGFYGVLFDANSKLAYDEYLPDAKRMIGSFTVYETGPVVQEDIDDVQEGSADEEADDTFVGSAGSDDGENVEQDNE